MTGYAIAAAVILILLILVALFRLHTLVDVVKTKDKKSGVGKSNQTNAILMMVFLIVSMGLLFWYSITRFDDYNLPVASEHGVTTDRLFWVTMAITFAVFFVTQILLF